MKGCRLVLLHGIYLEHVKIFSGNGTLEYHKQGCCPNNPGSYVEIPFMRSNNIAVNILLTQLQSRITSHFVILKHGLHSGTKKCYLSLCFEFAQSPYFLHPLLTSRYLIRLLALKVCFSASGVHFIAWCYILCTKFFSYAWEGVTTSLIFTHLCNF